MTSSRARAGPARSVTRCTPPMKGVIPTTRSTKPKRAASEATIRSQASESSNPQVRHSPPTDEIVGKGMSSTRRVIARRSRASCSASSPLRPSKIWTSTPPVKTFPSARKVSARRPAPSASLSATSSSSPIPSANRLSGGASTTIWPTSPCCSKRIRSATELGGHLGQLALLGLHRLAGQAKWVVLVARDHVDVEVEDGLPRRGLGRDEQIDPVGPEVVAHPGGQPLGGAHHPAQALVGDVVDVAGVLLGNHQCVPAGPRIDVHERQRVLVLVELLRRQLAGSDPAEEAVVVGHGAGSVAAPWPR